MAKFIGSHLKTDNWGEDFFVKKLMEYFDDSYVICRNRPVFGAQFDVCLLAPNIGIIIFEVKAWKRDTILRVENGDRIVIKSFNEENQKEEESFENPTDQARGYVYKMRQKVRTKTGKNPLIYEMVCFPNLTKREYDDAGIEPVCESEITIVKEDLASKADFYAKMNLAMKNRKRQRAHSSDFDEDLMFRTCQIFEPNFKLEDMLVEDTDLVEAEQTSCKSAYSIFAYIPHDSEAEKRIKDIAVDYAKGTKLYLMVEHTDELSIIGREINNVLANKGLITDKLDLKIDFTGKHVEKEVRNIDSFIVFNCSAYLLPHYEGALDFFTIIDGKSEENYESFLKFADKESNFNIEQYKVEHSNLKKNIIVRAGAGTGKTFTMISRIAFICHMQNCAMKEMANRIVMITFTDDAANQMEDKIKRYFNNYYLLTGDTDCLAFINQIEDMQISTIHSYAKKIISQLGFEFGYGVDIGITSGEFKRKQIIAKVVDEYIVAGKKKYGSDYVKKLGLPVYLINKDILNLLNRLHNQSIDIAALEKENFGQAILGSENGELHELLSEVVPKIERKYEKYLKEQNKLHLNNMMSMFRECVFNKENAKRLKKMQTEITQFMFVDEFQDTDDVQIEALSQIAKLLQYRLFVVGDVKQCIYRFRGAKENAFDQLKYKNSPAWETFALYKNYRTDGHLLDIFHESFASMGKQRVDDEVLLMYSDSEFDNSDRLIGTRDYNHSLKVSEYYHKVSIQEENMRVSALFEEVKRQIALIRKIEKENGKRLPDKEREIAILVRENWQAEIIKKEGKLLGIDVVTNTGGDLYMSEPALDMLKLANALLHYDEADYLYSFVSSNFIAGGMSKARMYNIREGEKKSGWKKTKSIDTSQSKELQAMINRALSATDDARWKDWNSVIRSLRTMPILQVIRKLYYILKPWVQYGEDSKLKKDNYRLNVDLLFEELINATNMDSVTINSLVDILTANIVSQKNVDSRMPEVKDEEIIVRCVTVHKAKGLEYGAVILPYCSSPINMMKRVDMNVSVAHKDKLQVGYQIQVNSDEETDIYQNDFFNEDLEKNERMREEARILYVAMTRAIRSFAWIELENKKSKSWQNLIWEET